MTGAVAPETTATAPQEREWRWYVLALVMMTLVTAASGWPAATTFRCSTAAGVPASSNRETPRDACAQLWLLDQISAASASHVMTTPPRPRRG